MSPKLVSGFKRCYLNAERATRDYTAGLYAGLEGGVSGMGAALENRPHPASAVVQVV